MVLGLVWDVIRWRDRSARCCDRLVPCVSGRLLALRRVLLPGGGPLQQHPDVREHQLGFPFRSAPRSVSSRAEQSGAVEASEGRAKTDCGAGSENGKSMRVEEEEHAQRSRFLAGRGHSCPHRCARWRGKQTRMSRSYKRSRVRDATETVDIAVGERIRRRGGAETRACVQIGC